MTRVKIVDVVNRTVVREGDSPPAQFSVVVLADESNRKALPIWIGRSEGAAIAMGVRHGTTPRPLTFVTVGQILRATGTEIAEVEINRLEGDTFHARIGLRTQSGTSTVDARPSDALAMAVQFDAPIHVADEVLAQAGIDVDGNDKEGQDGKSLDAIVAEIEDPARWRRIASWPEGRERACRELISEVFGSLPPEGEG
jgi:hypothetical protein